MTGPIPNSFSWRALGVLALVLLVSHFGRPIFSALYPLLFGILIAVTVHPMVTGLERRGFTRLISSTIVFTAVFLLLGASLYFAGNQLSKLFAELFALSPSGEASGIAYQALHKLEEFLRQMDERFQLGTQMDEMLKSLPQRLASSWKEIASTASGAVSLALGVVGSAFNLLTIVLLAPLFAVLVVNDLEKIEEGLSKLAPPEKRTHTSELLHRIGRMLGDFLRGRLLTGLVKGIGQVLLLWIFGLPYPLLTGILSWFFSFIPAIGPLLAFLPTLLLSAVVGGPWDFWIALGILFLGEALENYLLIPRWVGAGLGLSMLEVLIALLLGGVLLGFMGLLLAVPAAAIVKLLLQDWIANREQKLPA